MQEQKTVNLLNFSVNEFNTHCQELLKEMVEKNIKNCFADIEEKLISERNNNISKAICGKDLYDYSELEDIYYKINIIDEKGKPKDELVNVSTDEGYYKLMKMIEETPMIRKPLYRPKTKGLVGNMKMNKPIGKLMSLGKTMATEDAPTTAPPKTRPTTKPRPGVRPSHPGKNPNPGVNPEPKAMAEKAKKDVLKIIKDILNGK